MRAILSILGIAIAAIVLSAVLSGNRNLKNYDPSGGSSSSGSSTAASDKPKPSEDFKPPMQGAITTVMTVENRGDVTIELYPKAAPKTVAQFTKLIRSGYYNGIRFHRVRPGFVAQAGDPVTRNMKAADIASLTDQNSGSEQVGTHGSGTKIPFEDSKLQNVPGTVAMALSGPRSDTADSQFFINLVPNHMLDSDYCVFGKVVQGMDVVNNIQQGDAITRFVVK